MGCGGMPTALLAQTNNNEPTTSQDTRFMCRSLSPEMIKCRALHGNDMGHLTINDRAGRR